MKYCIPVVLLLLSSCFVNPEGRVAFYDFNAPKKVVEQKIFLEINADSSAGVFVEKGDRNVTTRDVIYINFKKDPVETYEVAFSCDSVEWNRSPDSRLALIGVSDGKKWQFARDLGKDEEARMQQRFESEVLSKLSEQYTKSNETKACAE